VTNQIRISIASGKGGIGKTTVSVNLAKALSGFQKVTPFDCDAEEPKRVRLGMH